MNLKRLSTLIEYMESLPKEANEHFDMNASWATHRGDHSMKGSVTKRSLMDCGTTACAMGWAGSIPSFKRAGLRLEWSRDEGPVHRAVFDSSEAVEFFGLTYDQFWSLFNNDEEQQDLKSPQQWASYARRLVKEWQRGE